MIHENGGLQIIDFGVAGVVESKTDKRGTIIGTPHWMPPEQHKNTRDLKYGFEVSQTSLFHGIAYHVIHAAYIVERLMSGLTLSLYMRLQVALHRTRNYQLAG